jgi:PLP dependent protein
MIHYCSARKCCSLAFIALNAARRFSVVSSFSSFQFRRGGGVTTRSPAFDFDSKRSFASSTLAMSTEQEADVNVALNLQEVREAVGKACKDSGRDPSEVKLVAVSKTKPLQLVKDAYASGHKYFGENYAQELCEKAKEMNKSDIEWHFIGGLQSNKANMLVKNVVPYGKLVVETVASMKLANKLNNAMSEFEGKKLDIFVQVNTSGEDSKSGIAPDAVADLCRQISTECNQLNLVGIMTIGSPGDSSDLDSLVKCREAVAEALGVSSSQLGLSMGMSNDFFEAILKGSTNVRVGSSIFGARDYSNTK